MTRRVVGITGTLPIEVLLAAGHRVVDLNNRFISAESPDRLLERAHGVGFAPTQCAWTRGMVGAVLEAAGDHGDRGQGSLDEVVVVARGDCTQNRQLLDLLPALGGPPTRAFLFPPERGDVARMEREVARFAASCGVSPAEVDAVYEGLAPLRRDLAELDRRTWEDATVSGRENALVLVRATDLGGDRRAYEEEVAGLLRSSAARPGFGYEHRVAFFGVPPILSDVHDYLEERGAKVVLNETQRDFAQLQPDPRLATQYACRYAYAYSIHDRIAAWLPELQRRRAEGVVIVLQSFCHHNAELEAVQGALASIPHVVLEADRPGGLDAASRLRLDTFLATLPRPRRRKAPGPGAVPIVGLDLGSRRTKVVVREPREPLRRAVLETVPFLAGLRRGARGGLVLDHAALARLLGEEIGRARVVSTGYGRYSVRLDGVDVVPEIQAHAAGARAQSGLSDFVLADLGGQDVKVIAVAGGRVQDFVLNDKCAAGSGRYLENMARLLDIPLERFLSEWEEPAEVSATCATFGETEVISRLVEGASLRSLAAGVNLSVVRRLLPHLTRFPSGPVLLAGGAAGPGLHRLLVRATGREVQVLPDPVFNGALGCTVLEG